MSSIKTVLKRYMISMKSQNTERDPNLWVFGEWMGRKADDNSLFLANYVKEKHPSINVIWVANKDADLHLLRKDITVIDRCGSHAISSLKKAGVAVVNENIVDLNPDSLNYASGAILVNLWHGLPWKHIFNDALKKSFLYKEIYQRLEAKFNYCKYWLTPSSDLERIVISSHYARRENCIETGYPRNSYFYNSEKVATIALNVRKAINANPSSKIIAYMPTFRDAGDEVFDFELLIDDLSFISWLADNNLYIIQKAHFVNQAKHHSIDIKKNPHIVTNNSFAAFELMAAADILVTDYSSCFFDYLILDRPIIHFIYDYYKYANEDRGLYYSADEVCCGDAVETVEDLKHSLAANLEKPYKDKELRRKRRNRFINYENDHSCEDIYQFVKDKVEKKFKTSLD